MSYSNAHVELPIVAQQNEKARMQRVQTIYRMGDHEHRFYF